MVARVTMCDGASTDYSVAGLLDTPQFTLLLHKRGFGEKKCIKYSCQRSWFSRWKWLNYSEDKDAWLNRFNKIKINRFGLHTLYKYFISMLIQSLDDC